MVTFAESPGAIESRSGIRVLPDESAAHWPEATALPAIGERPPAKALDDALKAIATRYGTRTGDFVAMQLEYPTQSRSIRE